MLTQRLGSRTQKDTAFIDSLIAEIKNHPDCCDEVWFATDYGFPPLPKHEKSAAALRESAEKFRAAGVRVSLQLSNSIGHGQYMRSQDCTGLVSENSPVGKMVDADGTVADYCFCWNDEYFRNYTYTALRYYLKSVKPHTVWVDDDLRATNHAPVSHGCFCDGCIEKFNSRYGTAFDREGLVNAIHRDIETRKKHIEFLRDTLADFTYGLGRVIHEELPECNMGLQGCANGGYTGYGYEHIFDAMKNATGLNPCSRPGGGAYNDNSPKDFINKSIFIAYQNLMLPPYVEDRRPEIENLPDVVYGKSIAGTCLETTCYLANGNTAMSYALLMNDYEPMSWHGEMLGAFSVQRKYWEKLANISKRGTREGLTPYFPKTAYLAESKEKWDYSKEEIFFTEGLNYCAIPVAFTNKEATVYVINGRIAERLNDEEIKYLLSKPVVCDGEAVSVLHKRGYIKNMDAERVSVQERREIFAEHPANKGFEKRTWGGQIWRQYDWELKGEAESIISEYFTESGGGFNKLGIASAVFTTEKGAKWAAFGFDMWERTKSTQKRNQLLNTCKYLCGKGFSAELETPLQAVVMPSVDEHGKCIAVSIINCTAAKSGTLKLKIREPHGEKFTFMSMTSPEISLDCEITADGGYLLTLPDIDGWSVGTAFSNE